MVATTKCGSEYSICEKRATRAARDEFYQKKKNRETARVKAKNNEKLKIA
jgi:hypothetical protein